MSTAIQPTLLPVERETTGPFAGIVTMKLDQSPSPMVVLDHELIRRIEATLRELMRSGNMTGLILASASLRVFIAGADLKTIQSPHTPGSQGWNDEQLDKYLEYGQRVFGMIADLPCPTAAAINGAALGGGLEIAMHCDGLIAAPNASGKPYPVGLPEAGLNICPGWGGTNLLPARMEPGEAIRRTAEGKPMTFDEAKAAGLFDAVAETPDDLLPATKRWLVQQRELRAKNPRRPDAQPTRWIGRLEHGGKPIKAAVAGALDIAKADPTFPKTDAANSVLKAVAAGLSNGWLDALAVERRELTRLRNTPAGQAAIAGFFEKTKK